ncbi:MAG: hypothetical protein AAB846_01285 [Patescibacteria group bacterium]
MLSYTDLTPGTEFVMDGEPYMVADYQFVRMQQRRPTTQIKARNLITGKITSFTAQQSDIFPEARIEKGDLQFIYAHRGEYVFQKPGNPKERMTFTEDILGESAKFLKPNLTLTAFTFKDNIINLKLPVKVDYKVKDAPEGLKGNTAQGGSKSVTLENGLEIQVPLFINSGDVIRVNTESGVYTERVEKA